MFGNGVINTMSENDGNKLRCPTCKGEIQGDDVNVSTDVAYCRACNLAHRFSGLVTRTDLIGGVDFTRPPAGVDYNNRGDRLVIRATHRSVGAALGALAVALFWNGIVSVFVLLAIASTLNLLGIPLPNWFPAPNMQANPMGLGMTLFMWLFLTPFILIGVSMISLFFLSIGGRTEIQIDPSETTVFTGVGPLGYRRRFLTSQVSDVRLDEQQWRDRSGNRQGKIYIVIEMQGGRLIRLGSMLSEERRKFVGALLNKTLVRAPDR